MTTTNQEHDAIEGLMSRLDPATQARVRLSLLRTLTMQIHEHADGLRQIEQLEFEIDNEDFGCW